MAGNIDKDIRHSKGNENMFDDMMNEVNKLTNISNELKTLPKLKGSARLFLVEAAGDATQPHNIKQLRPSAFFGPPSYIFLCSSLWLSITGHATGLSNQLLPLELLQIIRIKYNIFTQSFSFEATVF